MLYFLMETALGGDLYTAYLKNALHGSLSRRSFGGWGLGGLGFLCGVRNPFVWVL